MGIQTIKANIAELKKEFSIKEIDYQIIIAFSLNYEKIPVLLPLLSEPKIEEKFFFVHNDQMLLFHLLKNNVSFPLSIKLISENYSCDIINTISFEKSLYEELQKQNKLDQVKKEIKRYNKNVKEL